MGKNRKKRKASSGNPPGKSAGAAKAPARASHAEQDIAASRSELTKLIAADKTKAALELAKQMHKDIATPASEQLLAEAYAARIRAMTEKGMTGEARALLELARKRHPGAAEAFAGLEVDVAARSGDYGELLRPLADPGLASAERRTIEDILMRRATDLKAIARCEALPAEHPLRRAAHAAWIAFEKVTSGPVEDEVIALPEISRRSPLAPWKAFIRALAAFYRHEDDACRRYLGTIGVDSAPAKMAAVLGAILDREPPPKNVPGAQRLMDLVYKEPGHLRRHLEQLDECVEVGVQKPRDMHSYCQTAYKAVRLSQQMGASFANRLQRYLWVLQFKMFLDIRTYDEVFPKPVPLDASLWALLAKAEMNESEALYQNPLIALAAWDEFICHAQHEGLFEPESLEVAYVYRMMAAILDELHEVDFSEFYEEFPEDYPPHEVLYHGQPRHIREAASSFRVENMREAYFFDPAEVRRRIVAADPSPKSYSELYEWSRKNERAKETEAIALRWHEAFPNDAAPLLLLMEAAEERKAYKKALNYLKQAEAINALDSRVRRAHFRLHLAAFGRHIKNDKPHLAEKDLEAIAALPTLEGEDRRAILAALRATVALLARDAEKAEEAEKQAAGLLGDPLAAKVLCWGVASHFDVPEKQLPTLPKASAWIGKGRRAAAVARAAAAGREVGLALPAPQAWEKKLKAELRDHGTGIEPAHLAAFAETQIESGGYDRAELAFYATRAGLLQDGPHVARLMLLREQTLPARLFWRCGQCLRAAAHLARPQRQFDVLDAAVDAYNESAGMPFFRRPGEKLEASAEHVQHAVAFERKEKKYPGRSATRGLEKPYYPQCQCEECQEGRRIWTGRGPVPEAYEVDSPPIFGNRPPGAGAPGLDIPKDLPRELERELNAVVARAVRENNPPEEVERLLMECFENYVTKHPEVILGLIDREDDEEGAWPGKQGELFDDRF